jgi:hypothetical protein
MCSTLAFQPESMNIAAMVQMLPKEKQRANLDGEIMRMGKKTKIARPKKSSAPTRKAAK